jgi:PAS domain S-box-containing protein
MESSTIRRSEKVAIAAIFIVFISAVAVFAYLQQAKILGDQKAFLESVTAQKRQALEFWYMHHMTEGNETEENTYFTTMLASFARAPSRATRKPLDDYFSDLAYYFGYANTELLTPDGRVLFALKSTSPNASSSVKEIAPYLETTAFRRRPVFTHLYNLPPQGKPGCNLIIPIYRNSDDLASKPFLYIVHYIEAQNDIYPMLESWPTLSKSAESLLLENRGGTIHFLNSPKVLPGSALGISIPMNGSKLVEADAFLHKGHFFIGTDYRGKKVLAYADQIPEMGWTIVSKMDLSEIMKPWWGIFILLVIVMLAGTIALAMAVVATSRHRSVLFFRRNYEAEKSLRASEQKFFAFMDRIPAFILIKDSDSKMIYVNQMLKDKFGAESWIGKKPDEIFGSERAANILELDRKALEEGYVEYDEKHMDKSGMERFLRTINFRIDQADAKPLLGQIISDMTEREASFRQIRSLNDLLEAKVNERTAQLELSNEELRSFAYSVSHDLRSPLRSIEGFSKILTEKCEGKLDDESRHYFERIRLATHRMEELIDGLLSLSKIAQTTLNKESVDIGKIAENILSDYILANPEKRITSLTKPHIMADCDENLITVLLQNLIDNAFKFSAGKSEIHIEIGSSRQEVDGAAKIVYFVSDNGVGFDMLYVEQLFKPFHRLHSSEQFQGVGVGLASAKNIVDRHSGKIWLESEPDVGTTVFFTLD